jgi:phage repressor protein C with HTH and peptisase S24 domain
LTGREVKYKLELAGYSLVNIASLIGISPQNLQNKLRSSDVKIGFLQDLAKAINRSVYYFIGESGKDANAKVNPIDEKDIIREAQTFYSPRIVTIDSNRKPNIMLVPAKARADYLFGYSDPEYIQKLEVYYLPGCRNGYYRMFEVDGYSMYPTFSPGDFIIGKQVTDCRSIKKSNVYIIVSGERIIIKRVLSAQKSHGKIVFYSDNPDLSAYPHIEIDPEQIKECWQFHKVLTGNTRAADPVGKRILHLEAEIAEIKHNLKKK